MQITRLRFQTWAYYIFLAVYVRNAIVAERFLPGPPKNNLKDKNHGKYASISLLFDKTTRRIGEMAYKKVHKVQDNIADDLSRKERTLNRHGIGRAQCKENQATTSEKVENKETEEQKNQDLASKQDPKKRDKKLETDGQTENQREKEHQKIVVAARDSQQFEKLATADLESQEYHTCTHEVQEKDDAGPKIQTSFLSKLRTCLGSILRRIYGMRIEKTSNSIDETLNEFKPTSSDCLPYLTFEINTKEFAHGCKMSEKNATKRNGHSLSDSELCDSTDDKCTPINLVLAQSISGTKNYNLDDISSISDGDECIMLKKLAKKAEDNNEHIRHKKLRNLVQRIKSRYSKHMRKKEHLDKDCDAKASKGFLSYFKGFSIWKALTGKRQNPASSIKIVENYLHKFITSLHDKNPIKLENYFTYDSVLESRKHFFTTEKKYAHEHDNVFIVSDAKIDCELFVREFYTAFFRKNTYKNSEVKVYEVEKQKILYFTNLLPKISDFRYFPHKISKNDIFTITMNAITKRTLPTYNLTNLQNFMASLVFCTPLFNILYELHNQRCLMRDRVPVNIDIFGRKSGLKVIDYLILYLENFIVDTFSKFITEGSHNEKFVDSICYSKSCFFNVFTCNKIVRNHFLTTIKKNFMFSDSLSIETTQYLDNFFILYTLNTNLAKIDTPAFKNNLVKLYLIDICFRNCQGFTCFNLQLKFYVQKFYEIYHEHNFALSG